MRKQEGVYRDRMRRQERGDEETEKRG